MSRRTGRNFVASLVITFHSLFAVAQDLHPSNTYVRTCLSNIECSAMSGASFLFYDRATEKFYIKIDFNAFKSGQDSVDFWLQDLDDTFLFFKASVKESEFPSLSSYNARTIRMDGQLFLNGLVRSKTIDMSLFRAEDDLQSNSTGENFNAYKVNLSFSFSPKDFNINKKPARLTNNVFIGINAGFINLLTPGMGAQLGAAYLEQ